jgi:LacI family transcriptional regulator
LPDESTILVAHVNEDLSNSAHLIEKEEGFRKYFKQVGIHTHYQVHRLELGNPDSATFAHQLTKIIKDHPNLKGIFVTNSKAYEIAFYLEKHRLTHIKLIGYDLLPKNIHYLENGVIQFLINQNPKAQGYWGIYQLSDHLVFKKDILPIKYLPLDIITKENLNYYIDAAQ